MATGRQDDDCGAAGDGRPDPFGRADPPVLALTLWPNRSLSRRGFVRVVGAVGVGAALLLAPFLGTPAVWGLAPFAAIAPVALYLAIRRSYADGRLTEELRLWPDLITVERREPRGAVRRWHADPHWVRLRLIDDAPVEKYLTLTGNGREIELGAFLSPGEREALYRDLRAALGRLRPAGVVFGG
ncbi:DUF2244 domain-containing protein [Amaricoccus sp.]|uniref:DUF2244 domain-containing protein n=1 Tax=Amaricoccus sp. TaxID=1872485 RepID=UPI0025C0781C|nr:DUF2244 domain-containing protein [Amaricoccus sp.]